ncbi:MAG: hypothetical protein LM583_09960 [Desulfurococcaceae archaeon]|nr:hypothetical protein [Desulfurococcaceae archaeon]
MGLCLRSIELKDRGIGTGPITIFIKNGIMLMLRGRGLSLLVDVMNRRRLLRSLRSLSKELIVVGAGGGI